MTEEGSATLMQEPCKDAIILPGLIRTAEELAIFFSLVSVDMHYTLLEFGLLSEGSASTVMAVSKSEF